MRKSDLEDIRAVVRRVQSERFPGIDAAFIDLVLEIEAKSSEDDTSALRQIREAVDQRRGSI